jgi:RNA polymerase sigma-70 factor (ECF subfamily)
VTSYDYLQVEALPAPFALEAALLAERPRLVRLCAHLAGDASAADDLAQETLIEAWRNAHKLTEPAGHAAWLSAIARLVCLRWARRTGRELTRFSDDRDLTADDHDGLPDDDFDVEVELERGELALLLDRALGALPAETRLALIERFVAGSPLAEVAARLGLSEGNAAVRLHRGKLALRRVLTTTLREEAQAFGLIGTEQPWQLTRIWCADCGQAKVLGRMNSANGDLSLRCPRCYADSGLEFQETQGLKTEMGGAKSFGRAFNKLSVWANGFYRPALANGTAPCTRCGAPVRPRVRGPARRDNCHYIDASCSACNSVNTQSLRGTILSTPEGTAFWKRHERIVALPEHSLEAEGQPALALTFQSVRTAERLDAVVARDTFRILHLSQ